MADKIINTRIMLKIDTLANWQNESAGEGKGANYVLKHGEIGFAEIPSTNTALARPGDAPTVLFKVGDGSTAFKNLKWGAAVAADVYAWAKKETLEWGDLSNTFKQALQTYIEDLSDIDTNTIYQVVTGATAGTLEFQSADGTAATPTWTTQKVISLADFGINVTAQEINNISSASSITQQDIDNWNNEIGASDLAQEALDAIDAMDVSETFTGGQVLSTFVQEDGQITMTKRTLGAADVLTSDQQNAVNSGITAAKVSDYDDHIADDDIHVTAAQKTTWSGKQDALSNDQLAAVNSGITAAKVSDYDDHIADTDIHVTTADKAEWSGKQDALTFMTAYSVSNPVATQADIADIAGAMHFRGIVTGADAATALATITDPEAGDIAIYGTTEYVYNGTAWQILGDEGVYETQTHASQTYVPKTTEVNGHALSGDIDLDAADVGVVVTANSVTDGTTTISNIVSDANYVHTDNNYTTTEKTKLAGIEEGAQVNYINSVDEDVFAVDNGELQLADGLNLVSDEQITLIESISEGATKVEASQTNGNIVVDDVEVTVYDDSALDGRVDDLEDAVDLLNDDDQTPGSVDYKIAQALSGIEDGAQENVLEAVKINGTALSIDSSDKSVNINTYSAYDATSNKIATMSDISTDNLLQGVNEFVLNCGTSDVQ